MPVNYKVIFLAILLGALEGCGGVDTYEQTNCVPSVEFESTKSMRIISAEVLNPFYSYSYLARDKSDLFIEVRTPSDGGFKSLVSHKDGTQLEGQDMRYTILPIGARFRLTGNVKKTKPWGVYIIGGSGSYHFEAKQVIRTADQAQSLPQIYWFGAVDLSVLTRFTDESALNLASAKAVGVGLWGGEGNLGTNNNWRCPLGERKANKVR